ncbi:ArsR/SmtB family transcription factor [Pelagibacterium montanilacus]|uniref:ArsR/SmtB family transcription factor n=1 Tax=Pelagibacterium montanilacus TaxID=2185280 RepID=UPI000F8EAAAA|nr:metalloregulator ArsR/SmtB family transcription factor [Pelagibacterium montanilacus]
MVNMEITLLEDKAEEATRLLSAMANTKRLLILCSLLGDELSVGELSRKVDLPQSPLSQHLGRLRALGLVSARRQGQQVLYALASREVEQVLETLYGIYCAPD